MNVLSSNKNQTEKIDTPPRVSNKNNLDHILINRKMQKKNYLATTIIIIVVSSKKNPQTTHSGARLKLER